MKKILLLMLFLISTSIFAQYTDFGNHRFYSNGMYRNGNDTIYNPLTNRWIVSQTSNADAAVWGFSPFYTFYDTTASQPTTQFYKQITTLSDNANLPVSNNVIRFTGSPVGTVVFGGAVSNTISFNISGHPLNQFTTYTNSGGEPPPSASFNKFMFEGSMEDTLQIGAGVVSQLDFEGGSAGNLKRFMSFYPDYNYWANGATYVDTLIDFYGMPDPKRYGGSPIYRYRHYHFYGAVTPRILEGIAATQNPYWYEGGTMILGTLTDTTARSNIKGDKTKRWIGEDISPTSSSLTNARDTVGGILASHFLSDTSSFSDSATRCAVYIKGAKSTDTYQITWRVATGDETTVPTEIPHYYAKTDSLIVFRSAGTTSNLKFSYERYIKQ